MVENFLRVDSLDALHDRRPTFLAIGVFDGVHRGHQQLLSDMVAAAQAAGARPAVLTFFPHPMVVIRNLRGRIYLTTLSHRVTLLSRLGIELVEQLLAGRSTRAPHSSRRGNQTCIPDSGTVGNGRVNRDITGCRP